MSIIVFNPSAPPEIPLFHVMTASVTFGNINGHMEPAPHMSLHRELKKAEPVAVTTPTSPPQRGCRLGGIKHRGSSTSVDGEKGEGRTTEGGERETTPPVPPAR